MTIGTPQDMRDRLYSLLPPWFGDDHPNLDAILQGGFGTVASYIYGFYTFAALQTRIKTATGGFLDLIAQDFFGDGLLRCPNESDNAYRIRILAILLQPKNTYAAMVNALTNLTGIQPVIIQQDNPKDTIALDSTFVLDSTFYGGLGYTTPYTAIIYAFLPIVVENNFIGIGAIDNDSPYGGMGFNLNFNNAIIAEQQNIPCVSNQDVLNVIQQTKVFGTHMIVYINGILQNTP